MKIKRVLISVTDKTGLVEFANVLTKSGAEIFSTGGTLKGASVSRHKSEKYQRCYELSGNIGRAGKNVSSGGFCGNTGKAGCTPASRPAREIKSVVVRYGGRQSLSL